MTREVGDREEFQLNNESKLKRSRKWSFNIFTVITGFCDPASEDCNQTELYAVVKKKDKHCAQSILICVFCEPVNDENCYDKNIIDKISTF